MDFTILTEHFVLVVMVACLGGGYILKHSTIFKWLPNEDIPVTLAVLGAILNAVVSGISVESIVYGAIMGLASTGTHQSFKNWVENKSDRSEE